MLAAIAKSAPDLRAAGVLEVTVDGVSFKLDRPDPEQNEQQGNGFIADPLKDPSTFGGVLPGFRRREAK